VACAEQSTQSQRLVSTIILRRKPRMRCTKCYCIGQYQPCKGSGRWLFSRRPNESASWHVMNPARVICVTAAERSKKRSFSPYIYVEHSLRIPTSITAAAFTRAPWRFIVVPKAVLLRDTDAQRGWVSWRIRRHYGENGGKCSLFGSITEYRWQRNSVECIRLDTRGNVVEVINKL
jgi:hypothetical protein